VGNDLIKIIWSDDTIDYDINILKSQFRHVHIVVYPLASGFYRVQIIKKSETYYFGPLQNEMVVTEELLPFLCLSTAINAYRAVRNSQEGYKNAAAARRDLIKQIADRHKVDYTPAELMTNLFL